MVEVCAALSAGQADVAGSILAERYPFVPFSNAGRHYTKRQALAIFRRDGFTDRYSGTRLLLPAALRLVSMRLGEHFPFHPNWRTDACHFAYWELCPTVDHLMPVSRGGADDETNWVTTSMVRNAAKSNFTMEELGWALHPVRNGWDGLTGWFVKEAKADPPVLATPYMREWYAAAA
jgi:hypothetical protein